MAAKKRKKAAKGGKKKGGKKKAAKKRGNYVPLKILKQRATRLQNIVSYREKNPSKFA